MSKVYQRINQLDIEAGGDKKRLARAMFKERVGYEFELYSDEDDFELNDQNDFPITSTGYYIEPLSQDQANTLATINSRSDDELSSHDTGRRKIRRQRVTRMSELISS